MLRLRARPAEIRNAERINRTQSTDTRHTDKDVTPDRYGVIEHTFDNTGRDDMAERDREIGRRVHALVASFCRSGVTPEPMQVWVAAGKMFAATPMVLNHSSRQRAACAVSSYFFRFHRPAWQFVGAEVALGTGRVDLVWQLPTGQYVLDELKTGAHGDAIEDRHTLEQIARYRAAAAEQWGDAFAGVRLLPLTSPGRSRFHPARGVPLDLSDAHEGVR